jgi:hypothetical protein
VDAGFDEPTAFYGEAVILNAGKANPAVPGDPDRRSLWFMIGNRIRVSALKDYSYVIKEIDAGSGGSLYSPGFNINSADLIGEMIYQSTKNASKNTRLGRLRGLAKSVRAAKARAVREEEKRGDNREGEKGEEE